MTAHATYQGQNRFGSLDGLRALAIAAVLWHHWPGRYDLLDAKLSHYGFLGVDLFFVISGYLITTLLLREEARDGAFSLPAFYWRRVLRILPVYYLVVTAVGVYYIVLRGETQYLDLWPWYYLFLSNFLIGDIPMLDPTWSLAVEEQFYLIWPVLLLLAPRRWVLPLLGGLVVANVAGMLWQMQASPPDPLAETGVLRWALPNATYAPILMGAALAVLLNGARGFAAVWPVMGPRWAAPVWLLVVLGLIVVLPDRLLGWPNLALHLAMCALVGACVIREDNGLARALQLRLLVRLGTVSYGVYLYHLLVLHPIMIGAARFDQGLGWGLFVFYVGLNYIVAEISFATYERYFTRFRGRPWGRAPRVEVRS